MEEYPQYPNGKFGDAVAACRQRVRRRTAGVDPEVQGLGDRSERLHLFHHAGTGVEGHLRGNRQAGVAHRSRYATPKGRLPHLMEIFGQIEEWTKTKTKFEAMDILNKHGHPLRAILSMKEIAEEPSLRATGTVVEVDHPTRGKYLRSATRSRCPTARAR